MVTVFEPLLRVPSSHQLTLTKFAPVLVANDTYSVCVPVGAGELSAGEEVTQVCQPPVLFTVMVATGLAVRARNSNEIVPISVPDTAEARRASVCGYPLAKLTPVYSSQLPLPIQPTLSPPPASLVAWVATPLLAAA